MHGIDEKRCGERGLPDSLNAKQRDNLSRRRWYTAIADAATEAANYEQSALKARSFQDDFAAMRLERSAGAAMWRIDTLLREGPS